MPNKSLKPCREIGCNELTRNAYCKSHEKTAHKSREKYNRYKRDKNLDGFYKSTGWRRLRRLAFERDNGLCQRCLKRGVLTRADVVHHLVEVKEDWLKRLDLDNTESLCHGCHNAEHKTLPPGSNF